jgi:hypothetical protein
LKNPSFLTARFWKLNWSKFAQLSTLFYVMDESQQDLATLEQNFQVILAKYYINLSGFNII